MKLPEDFLQSLINCTGFDKEGFIASHESGETVTSIRINNQKIQAQQLDFTLKEQVPWINDGFYLAERPSFTLDPFFHAGAYYVQDASSMFLAEALKQTCNLNENLTLLDLCAAPGGKSTLIQSLISADSLLVSNEVIKSRVHILTENITKWGAANVVVTQNDASDFNALKSFFDVIVVDAPCSGSGLFRKDENALQEWSPEAVSFCQQRQQRILAEVLPSLKQNGVLIYSTCSFSEEENEQVALWLVQQKNLETVPLDVQPQWNIVASKAADGTALGYRFYPNELKGEGFFLAVFRKKEEDAAIKIQPGNLFSPVSKNDLQVLQQFIQSKSDLLFYNFKNNLFAFPQSRFTTLHLLQSFLYLKKAGVQLGTVVRNEFLPHHELALATAMVPLFPHVELDKNAALDYLRKKDFGFVPAVKGWALIKYRSLVLGFIKGLPGRVNNYYPKEWRILNK